MKTKGHLVSAVCWFIAFIFMLVSYINYHVPMSGLVAVLCLVSTGFNLYVWFKNRKK